MMLTLANGRRVIRDGFENFASECSEDAQVIVLKRSPGVKMAVVAYQRAAKKGAWCTLLLATHLCFPGSERLLATRSSFGLTHR